MATPKKTCTSTGKWVDVAFTNSTQVEVKSGVKDHAFLNMAKQQGFVLVDQGTFEKEMVVKPSTGYMFRVAAVNSMGVGPWSPVTAFKTNTLGAPQAPNSVKIAKGPGEDGGALLSWDIPPCQDPILDYTVFLAIKSENAPQSSQMATPKNAIFKQVYNGKEKKCQVNKDLIGVAAIDTTTGAKPAIIFRVVAKNGKGYGPATQVRWLLEKK